VGEIFSSSLLGKDAAAAAVASVLDRSSTRFLFCKTPGILLTHRGGRLLGLVTRHVERKLTVARAGAPSTVPRTILVFIIVSDDISLMVKYQKNY